MAIRCSKIKLKEGMHTQAMEWAAELNRRTIEVHAVLKEEGVTIEAAFLDKQADGYYLIYVMQSENFEKARAVTAQSLSPVEIYHKAFKQSSWESSVPLELLINFEVE